MSLMYCPHCDEIIDTDYNAEHFEECEEKGKSLQTQKDNECDCGRSHCGDVPGHQLK